MLPARPNALAIRWFDGWCRRAMRRHFHRVHLYPDDPSQWDAADPAEPRLYVANHCAFWDALLLNVLLRRRSAGLYCMADAQQVAAHPFFSRIGAFSVDRADPRDGMRAVRHAADLLKGGASVVIFPQGRIRPADARPLGFESGVGRIVRIVRRVPGVAVVPVGLRYEFWQEQRAEALVAIGREVRPEGPPREVTAAVEGAVESLVAGLVEAGKAQRAGRVVLRGKRSVSRWKEAFAVGGTGILPASAPSGSPPVGKERGRDARAT